MFTKLPPLPSAHANIYPLKPDEYHHDVCFTPSSQPPSGDKHYPVFTAEQMYEYARMAAKLEVIAHVAYLEQGEFE